MEGAASKHVHFRTKDKPSQWLEARFPWYQKEAKIHYMLRRELNVRLICIYLTPRAAQYLGLDAVLKYTPG